jgi:hypothetical protein
MEKKTPDAIGTLKVWLFPAIVTILSTIIWRDVSELKNDVKQLLAQSNIDKTRIDALEKQIDILNQNILKSTSSIPTNTTLHEYSSKEFILSGNKKKKYTTII